jgi:periplasmic protein TonB
VDMAPQRPVFPWMVCASVLLHTGVGVWCWNTKLEAPRLIPPQEGQASILLRVSAAAQPKTAEEILQKSLADVPPLPEVPHVTAETPKILDAPLPRPKNADDFSKLLQAENASVSPVEMPVLDPLNISPKVAQAATLFPPGPASAEGPLVRPKTVSDAKPLMRPEKTIVSPLEVPSLDASTLPVNPAQQPKSLQAGTAFDDGPQSLVRPKANEDVPLMASANKIVGPHELPALDSASNPLKTLQAPVVELSKPTPAKDPKSLARPKASEESGPLLQSETTIVGPVELPRLDPLADPLKTAKAATLVAPTSAAKEGPQFLARPKAVNESDPSMQPLQSVIGHRELPPLEPASKLWKTSQPSPIPPQQIVRDNAQPLQRPTAPETLPKFEALTKVADLVSLASDASDPSKGATVDEMPQKLAVNPAPDYPKEVVAAGIQGTVNLRVRIDAAGKVAAISLYSSSGTKALDDAALATVRSWVFVPARRAGRPVPFEVLVPIEFFIRRRT